MSRSKGEPVIFRKFPDGDVIALFGAMAGDMNPSNCDSYMHVGQHGAASPEIVTDTVPATPEEYAALKRELESPPYEYKLAIYQRFQPCWYAARLKANRKGSQVSKFRIEFSMDNAAFEDNATLEVARILTAIRRKVHEEHHWSEGRRKIMDSNGNTIGFWEYES